MQFSLQIPKWTNEQNIKKNKRFYIDSDIANKITTWLSWKSHQLTASNFMQCLHVSKNRRWIFPNHSHTMSYGQRVETLMTVNPESCNSWLWRHFWDSGVIFVTVRILVRNWFWMYCIYKIITRYFPWKQFFWQYTYSPCKNSYCILQP